MLQRQRKRLFPQHPVKKPEAFYAAVGEIRGPRHGITKTPISTPGATPIAGSGVEKAMEKLISEIQLLRNGGIPDDQGMAAEFLRDSGWPHYCALQKVVTPSRGDDLDLLVNGGIPDGLDFDYGAIDQPDVRVPRPVIAWFVVTSFLLAVAGNT
jgi:hypothetical protein